MTNHCTPEQSKALKEIGFDMEVRDFYTDEELAYKSHSWNWNLSSLLISAPTRSEVLQWAREKHGIDAWVSSYKPYSVKIYQFAYDRNDGKGRCFDRVYGYPTHPEAESALVWKIIEIIKEKKA